MTMLHKDEAMQGGAARKRAALAVMAVVSLAGCAGVQNVGDEKAKTVVTGSAGGSTTTNENKNLEKCDRSLGTLAVVEDQSQPWFAQFQRDARLTSTVPLIRLLVQQSNCFVVVERGRAMNQMQQERALRDSGEMRANSNMQAGQVVAADFSMNPSITFSQRDAGGIGGALGGLSRSMGVLGAVAGGVKFSDASTMLTLIDNRSGVQLAAAEGSARNTDFNLFGGLLGGSAGGSLGGYTNTPEGKVLAAAFIDSYNQLVKSVRNYRAQTVQGGLGTGGALGVQGGSTPASQNLNAAPAAPASAAPAPTRPAATQPAQQQRRRSSTMSGTATSK
jgi:hypothetical protein